MNILHILTLSIVFISLPFIFLSKVHSLDITLCSLKVEAHLEVTPAAIQINTAGYRDSILVVCCTSTNTAPLALELVARPARADRNKLAKDRDKPVADSNRLAVDSNNDRDTAREPATMDPRLSSAIHGPRSIPVASQL